MIDDEEKKKNAFKDEREKNHILHIGFIVILVGVILTLLAIIVSTVCIPLISADNQGILVAANIGRDLLTCLGTTVITIGAGTALYSYFDFVNYMQNKIKHVMFEYGFTDILSDEEKNKLAKKLEKEIIKQTEGNDLYDFVQEEVMSLAQQVFYTKFDLNIACEIEDNIIRKTIKKSYTMNCSAQRDFDIVDANNFTICHKNEGDVLKDISLRINTAFFSKIDDFEPKDEESNDEVYDKKVVYKLKDENKQSFLAEINEQEWNGIYNVESEFVSEVPIDDPVFSYRLYHPCRCTKVIFTYDPNTVEVMENIFVFKDTDLSNSVDNPVKVTRNKGSIVVEINNWILPGDGFVFLLFPVKKIIKSEEKS